MRREKAIEWKKSSEAVSETRTRAEEGNAKAEANLGNMYFHGRGVPQDYAEAVRWYRKAADQGDAEGQDGVAYMYLRGQGVPQDYAEALGWYRKAADQGYANAENGIALMYSQGQGVPIRVTTTPSALWALRVRVLVFWAPLHFRQCFCGACGL